MLEPGLESSVILPCVFDEPVVGTVIVYNEYNEYFIKLSPQEDYSRWWRIIQEKYNHRISIAAYFCLIQQSAFLPFFHHLQLKYDPLSYSKNVNQSC